MSLSVMESASYMHIWACSGVYVLIFFDTEDTAR